MNVIPVAAPGPASTGQLATRAESQQAQASASGRSEARQRQVALAAHQGNRDIRSTADHAGQQAISPTDRADRQKAEQLRAFIGDDNMRLSTYHDEASGRSILEVRDQTTGDVVSQYPSEELIRLYAALRQPLVDQSA